jgi:imidazolonepropionase
MAMSLLVTNIGELATMDPAREGPLGSIVDAALVAERGRVAWVGPARHAPAADMRIDVHGAAVIPGFVDSHTHLVFAGDRAAEFVARMGGIPYTGGGIATTVAATRGADDATLRANLARLAAEAHRQGTTTIEVKSGYGLSTVEEQRLLRLAREVTDQTTFLGAHVVPKEYVGRTQEYVALVTGQMLAAAAPHARWVDVFCERGAFDADEARTVLRAGMAAGLLPRVHANQLGPGPGVTVAVEVGAASADHCTHLSSEDVDALAGSGTVATLLPGAEFATRSPYPNARRLLDAGVTVALATDANPGSSYTTSMPFCIALAVREMRMTPAEALRAATAGGAAALRLHDVGRLSPGARADLAVLDAPSHIHLAYRPGVPLVRTVLIGGEAV